MIQCPLNTPAKLYLDIPESFHDSVTLSAVLVVQEKIAGDIDFVVTGSKCTHDLKTCAKINNINVKGVCQKFVDKNSFAANVFEAMQPALVCPVMPGNYTLAPTTLDLRFAKIFPIEGYVITINYKAVSTDRKLKTKRTVFCLNQESKIGSGRESGRQLN